MPFDAVVLARMQFAFTVGFHIIFPGFFHRSGVSFLAVLGRAVDFTGRSVYLDLFNYWKKIFALNFGMGVVSGLVLSYQFGTNWSVFSDKTGPIVGPLMGYEVLTAFFLEAGFLGVMLFGEGRVGAELRLFASCMVALGTAVSAFWITAVNSWMQTPQGYGVNAEGQYRSARLVRGDLQSVLSLSLRPHGAGGLSDHGFRRRRASPRCISCAAMPTAAVEKMFSMALWMAVLVAPVQIMAGDQHGLNTLEHQPAKIAAIEGHFTTRKRRAADPVRLARRGARAGGLCRRKFPHLGALILTHDWNGSFRGLDDFPQDQWPPVAIPFWSFRIMVGIGFAMFGLGLWGLYCRWRGVSVFQRLAASRGIGDGAVRLRRDARRLDHHRDGAAALYGLWPADHGAIGLSGAGARRRRLARRFCRGLSDPVRHGALLHGQADEPAAATPHEPV